MIKLVVFDWNGVLIADAQAVLDTENQILKMYGRKPITMKQYRDLFRMPVKDYFRVLGFSEKEMEKESKNIQKQFHEIYEPRISRVRTRAGARKLLVFLKDRSIKSIILSNHTKEGLEIQLKRLSIEQYFSRVITNNMHTTMQNKNKAEKLANIVKNSPYKRNEILIIGDSIEETEAGKRLGIKTVAITGGYYSTPRLREANPDHLIHNLTELITVIKDTR